jgi:hypothetical protein
MHEITLEVGGGVVRYSKERYPRLAALLKLCVMYVMEVQGSQARHNAWTSDCVLCALSRCFAGVAIAMHHDDLEYTVSPSSRACRCRCGLM